MKEKPITCANLIRILTYHSLDNSGSVISTSPEVFQKQIELLNKWGYAGVSLGQLLDDWEGKAPIPDRSVVLTFDDAFCNFAEHALPILTRFGFRATVFAVGQYTGGHNDWQSLGVDVPRLPLLSWSTLGDISKAGFEIGSHSMTHPVLSSLTLDQVDWELTTSRAVLEDRLGHSVTTFAYPYGLASSANRILASQRYRAACGVQLKAAHYTNDRCNLPRIDMYYFRSLSAFRLFPFWVGSTYLGLRSLGRTCRKLLGPKRGPKSPSAVSL